MIRSGFGLMCGVTALCVAGCSTVRTPQFFGLCRRDLTTESRLYEFHDPFPNEAAGPDTVTRPLAFVEPRTETRRDFDLRLLLSLAPERGGSAVASRRLPTGPLVSPIAPAVPLQATGQNFVSGQRSAQVAPVAETVSPF